MPLRPENVWDYPRPPRCEPADAHLTVVLDGITIAESDRAFRVLETTHPPNYYFPPDDILPGALERAEGSSFCEWKGHATYWNVQAGGRMEPKAAWSYATPSPGFEMIRDHCAFYAGRMEACYVDGELVIPQPGGFYGGWITSNLTGPFKGGPGTQGW